jgi:protein disulfide-isomerase
MRGVSVTKQISLAAFLWAAALVASAARADDAVHWESNLDAAKRAAAQTNRLVLIHFWAPWCGPCMRLESTVFNQPAVARDIESRFVPVKLNADDWPATARNFAIERLPTDVVIAPNGRVLYKLGCPQDPNQYVAQLSQAAAAAQGLAAAPPSGQPPSGGAQAPTVPLAASARPYGAPVEAAPNVPPPNATPPNVAVQGMTAPNVAPPITVASARPSIVPAMQGLDAVGGQVGSSSVPRAARNIASDVPPPSSFAQNSYASFAPHDPADIPAPGTATPSDAPRNSPQIVKPQSAQSATAQPLGLDGFCPVTLVERSRTAPDDPRCWIRGDPRWGAVHRGVTYLFNGPDEQKRFLANPDHYAPALGGIDAVLAFDRAKLLRGRREFGTFCESRIYLFASKETLDAFQKDPRRYVEEVRQAENPPHAAVR